MPKNQQSTSKQQGLQGEIDLCNKCEKNISRGQSAIECSTCTLKFHIQCQKISKAKYDALFKEEDDSILWFCESCRWVTKNLINKMSAMEKRLGTFESTLKSTSNDLKSVQKLCNTLLEKNNHLDEEMRQLKEKMEDEKDKSEAQCRVIDSLRRDL